MEQLAKTESANSVTIPGDAQITQPSGRSIWIGWSSFFFAVVQSVCSAFVALSGLRILIGAAAFGSALGLLKIADKLHFNAIRIPMMLLALLGSLFNLVAIWQVRRLRGRSASAWRQKSLTQQKTKFRAPATSSFRANLILLAVEYYFHHKLGKGLALRRQAHTLPTM